MSFDENIGPAGVHPARLRNPDAILGLLRGSASPHDAICVHTELGLKIFAFALLIDYRADHTSPDGDPSTRAGVSEQFRNSSTSGTLAPLYASRPDPLES